MKRDIIQLQMILQRLVRQPRCWQDPVRFSLVDILFIIRRPVGQLDSRVVEVPVEVAAEILPNLNCCQIRVFEIPRNNE